jgi:uncharacterized protein (TIGR02266 family)
MGAMPDEDDKKKGEDTPKRAHKRVDFFNPVKVVVPDDNTAVDVFAGNVSKGGMFLRSNRPLPKGKKVSLEFETEEGKVQVEEGEVVWNKEFEPISIDGSPAGMGVEFKSMSDDSKLKIEAFIDDALHIQPPPEEKAPPPPPAKEEPPPPQPGVSQPPSQSEGEPAEAEPKAEPMRMKLDVVTSQQPPPEPEKTATVEPPPVEGGEAVMATAPPRRRTKMMLFGGFVLLVAAVTFLTLLLIKPPGDEGQPEVAKPPAPEKPVPPEAPKKPEPVAEKKPAPAPAPEKKPAPAAEKKPEPIAEKKPKPAPAPAPDKKPEPVPADTIQGLQVGLPVFSEKDGEWRMVIISNAPAKIKHFTLKNPPRLAVDFKGAVYSGKKRTLESPAPSVARVRVGEQPEFTRFVLDFDGSEIPKHRIVKKEDRVVVFFGR